MGISKTERPTATANTCDLFAKMISLDHLFQCWDCFKGGKRARRDVQYFERYLEDHIFQLHEDLSTLRYVHGSYHHFHVFEPKERYISKTSVRDRLVHQAVHDVLSDVFDKKFIFHSFSSRLGKGTHLGVEHLARMINEVSHNCDQPCYGLKMDIKRFFDSVDHQILKTLIRREVNDETFLRIVDVIIDSFTTQSASRSGRGIPLGNVTSQLFANVYLHQLDLFVKHQLRERYYLRYCDDCLFLSNDKSYLQSLITSIREFLNTHLHLELHPKKVILTKLVRGIDFLGTILFPKHRLVRTQTKRRMKRRLQSAYEQHLIGKISASSMDQRLQSYLGILSHASQHTLSQALKNAYWVRDEEGQISPENFGAS